MRKVRVPVTNFAFGEVSQSTIMRTDTPIYTASAQRVENMFMLSEGGVKRRPGLERIAKLDGITRDKSYTFQSRLLPFIFSGREQYIVSLEHQQVRVFILDPVTGAVSLATTITQDTNSNPLPFDEEFIHEYTFAQYADVMFICHPLFSPRQLVRTGLTTFEVTPIGFDKRRNNARTFQPFSSFHPVNVTLGASATTGTVTLTTSAPYFDSLHVGVVLMYFETEIQITAVSSPTSATGVVNGTLRQRLEILNPLRTTNGSAVIEVTHLNHGFGGGESIVVEGASSVGGINAGQINGTRTIGSVIDENTYTITAGANANEAEDGGGFVKIVTSAPTSIWTEQSFSALRGYPAAVEFHESRLCFAGTISEPDTIWMSRSGLFYNFDIGDANDADAISLLGASGEVHEIRYLLSSRDLQVFAATSELYIPTFLNQSITPTNVQIRRQTPYGTTFVSPQSMDGATLFAQIGGNVIREYIYTDDENAYSATAVSTIASHLVRTPNDLAVCHGAFDASESYAVFSSPCGCLSLFSSNRVERRAGWCQFTAKGDFYSVCALNERLFATMWIDDGTGGEELILGEFKTGALLDCGETYTVTGPTLFVPFGDGVEVELVSNNGRLDYLGSQVVSNGEVVVPNGYTEVEVGLGFNVNLVSNPIDVMLGEGALTGEPRGVSSVIVDMRNTRSIKVNNRALSQTNDVNGKKEFRTLGYSRDPQVKISQNEPLPLQVNGFVAEVVF